MKLADFVSQEAIVVNITATDRDTVIETMIDALIKSGAAPKEVQPELIKEILDREKKGSTGFGKGVAVPHVKHTEIPKMVAAIGVSQEGIDFKALDKQPVYSVVLLLSPKDEPESHLQAMETVFGHLQNEMFRRFLRQATTSEAVVELIHEADANKIQG